MDDEDEAGQRLSNGSKQVPGPLPYFDPSLVGGERVTVRIRALAVKDSWVLVTRERAEVGRREERG